MRQLIYSALVASAAWACPLGCFAQSPPTFRPDPASPELKADQVEITYVEPQEPALRPIYQRLRERQPFEGLKLFFAPLKLPRKLPVRFEGCNGSANAWYRDQQVVICYEIIIALERNAGTGEPPRGMTRDAAVAGALVQIAMHQMSHAIVDLLRVPIFGGEELAVDQITAYLILEFGRDVTRHVLLSSEFVHGIGKLDRLQSFNDDYYSTHGTPTQSFENMLCVAYGGDPDAFSDFVQRGVLPRGRVAGCAAEYRNVRFAFDQLLLPFVDRDVFRRVSSIQWMTVADSADVRKADDDRIIPLLFATTRVVRGTGENKEFTDERSAQLTFGAVRVRVPEGHKIGQVERPWSARVFSWSIYRQTENDQKHFVIRANAALDRAEFIDTLSHAGSDEALVFVHGFNNTFEDGVFRLAQIVWDTQFRGTSVLFSWPAQGGTIFSFVGYRRDLDSAIFSRDGFLELLKLLQDDAKITKVHVIAHSMGNQIVMDALANAGPSNLKGPLGEVVLAAPDVDRDIFVSLASKIRQVGRGVTLYASSADKALIASKGLAVGTPRAGDVLPPPIGPVVVAGIDTIDVSAVGDEIFGLDHNVFAAKRSLIAEIARLILTGERPPNKRSSEIRGVPEGTNPPQYWRYAD